MRYIIIETHTDGFTFSCEEPIPIEYPSGESLICDFMDAAMAAAEASLNYFTFLDQEWRTENYVIRKRTPHKKIEFEQHNPEVLTIDEWFERNALRLPGVIPETSKLPKLLQLILALEGGNEVRKTMIGDRCLRLRFGIDREGNRIIRSFGWRSAVDPPIEFFYDLVTFPEEWEIVK